MAIREQALAARMDRWKVRVMQVVMKIEMDIEAVVKGRAEVEVETQLKIAG